ncbi:unnamed protein product [Cylindrotheca closterium]|uniref:RNase H type-1 domain-containing protein n=1 Tax=Cylindrotheca closterium TaxID=2856 RepID=A0AAD2CUJ7_9STRA|nr:unnamed protein product [Cylindrotheca closterium]
MSFYRTLIIYFDGACQNNPNGPAGCGWAIYEMDDYGCDGFRVASGNRYLGFNLSNNQAEYIGLIEALAYMQMNNIGCHELLIRGDSLLVINQMTGFYQIRNQRLFNFYNTVSNKLSWINSDYVEFAHIDRYYNGEADFLAKTAIPSMTNGAMWD